LGAGAELDSLLLSEVTGVSAVAEFASDISSHIQAFASRAACFGIAWTTFYSSTVDLGGGNQAKRGEFQEQ
jgi:hypothetical protein